MYRITEIIHKSFFNNPDAQLIKMHQVAGGWVGIIKDRKTGQEYVMQAVPVKSEVVVVPNTVDELLRISNEKNY